MLLWKNEGKVSHLFQAKNPIPESAHLKHSTKAATQFGLESGKPSAKSNIVSSISCPKGTGNVVCEHRRGKKGFEKFARRATGH